jgi:hypothetical protein
MKAWPDGARSDKRCWKPWNGDIAYRELCDNMRAVPNMARENMQPLIEGGYPDSEVWIEQFGSYPELRIEGDALVFHGRR